MASCHDFQMESRCSLSRNNTQNTRHLLKKKHLVCLFCQERTSQSKEEIHSTVIILSLLALHHHHHHHHHHRSSRDLTMPPRRVQHYFPVPPVTIQTCKRVKGKMNHSYRDCSRVPPAADYVVPGCIEDMTFSQKIHDMLSKPAQYGHIIAWMPHGRAFQVLKPQLFEKHLCPLYFGHGRYSSFLRSLNNFGFKHLSRGPDRNCKCLHYWCAPYRYMRILHTAPCTYYYYATSLLFSNTQAIITSSCCEASST